MNTQDDNTAINQSLMTADEERELRQALRRMSTLAPDVDAAWHELRARMAADAQQASAVSDSEIVDDDDDDNHVSWLSRHGRLLSFVSGIAAALLLVALFKVFTKPYEGTEVFTANNATPEVTLTTSGGQPQVVTGKTLAFNQPGMVVKHSGKAGSKPQMLALTTPRGKDQHVTLPDGTQVVMNADSKIEFPEQFTGKERRVKCSGEVWFDVQKDADHPFVVETDYFNATVLGTSFAVRAFGDRDASLTLATGHVKLEAADGSSIDVTEGHKVVYSKRYGFNMRAVDVYPLIQWKDGFFYFDHQPFAQIMQDLGRWYNVNIVFEQEKLLDMKLHFVAEHGESLDSIIARLNALDVATVAMQDGAITIK